MAALVKFSRVASKLTNKSCLVPAVSYGSHWNKDNKPGPYPQTQKEREAAAKKYGIPVEEYEPYPDDGMGFGDYPKLPNESVDTRSAHYPYDFPEFKRNFGEPLHVDHDLYSEDRYSTARTRFTPTTMMLTTLSVVGAIALAYWWLNDKKAFRPVLPKQYPGDGKVHYTFELK
ncbi:CLUMA_CG006223, isoform A [Clunio marinus]|uniref:CLUMA_CG006223, isoform A n=1 Tax=Clunio marinus TaxID=568069 RepID=A0A1J1HXT8_9DIPT|nr:CLUMA_CG006223, isoform A [Clunio marinus]